jgi:hypothetical protein
MAGLIEEFGVFDVDFSPRISKASGLARTNMRSNRTYNGYDFLKGRVLNLEECKAMAEF